MPNRGDLQTALTVSAILLGTSALPGHAETWLVLPDGTGDVPTIQDAYDIAQPGDDILLGPGTFTEGDIIATPLIPLSTQEGPAETILDAAGYENAIQGLEESTPWSITGLTIRNCENAGISIEGGGTGEIVSCVIYHCGAGIYARDWSGRLENVTCVLNLAAVNSGSGFSLTRSAPLITNCISAFNEGFGIVAWASWPDPVIECSDLYLNQGGDYENVDDVTGQNGNISLDPGFCDLLGHDFRLMAGSPCAPFTDPNAACDLIGALGVGCGATPVQPVTWGDLKSRHYAVDRSPPR